MDPTIVVIAIVFAVAFTLLTRHVLAALAKVEKAAKTGGGDHSDREARLLALYNHHEELMDVFETYIEEVRKYVEKERTALLEMSRQASILFTRAMAPPPAPRVAVHEPQPDPEPPVLRIVHPTADPAQKPQKPPPQYTSGSRINSRTRTALDRYPTKPQRVRYLMGQGFPLEDVARELGIGTGEVRLIAELER